MKKIINILLALLFMACTTYPTPTPPQKAPDLCKYKTVSIYDQSCLNSVSGEWVEDSQSGAMVNKTHRKFCWSTGTKQVKYDCKEPENTQAQKAGTWKIRGGGSSCDGPFRADAEIWANGYGKFKGRGYSHNIYIDENGNVSSKSWPRFKGACSSNSYCSGTYKHRKMSGGTYRGTCVGTWEMTKLY